MAIYLGLVEGSSGAPGYRPMERMAPAGTWNRDRVIAALRDWAREFGDPPRLVEWGPPEHALDATARRRAERWAAEHPRWPSPQTVINHLGSWSSALKSAGLRPRVGPWEFDLVGRISAAKAMSARGESATSIAGELNVAAKTVRTYLRATPCRYCGGPVVTAKARSCADCRSRRRTPAWSEEDMLRAIRRWAREEGEPPRVDQWRPGAEAAGRWEREWPRWPSSIQVQWQFGRWHAALKAAGVDPHAHKPDWSPDAIRAAFTEFANRNGRAPGVPDLEAPSSGLPSHKTIRRRFGSIEAARQAAGLRDPYLSRWNRETIIEAIRAAHRAGGRPPNRAEWRHGNAEHPSVPIVVKQFGSWTQALLAADVVPSRLRWERETIIEALQRFVAEQGRPPTAADWSRRDPEGRWPSARTVSDRFGSWRAASEAAGLGVREDWSRDRILAVLRHFGRVHQRTPRHSELGSVGGLPSAGTIIRCFGSLSEGFEAADLEPKRLHWDRESVTVALRTFAQDHGRAPTYREWARSGAGHPSAKTAARIFGSWSAAKIAAGLAEPRADGITVDVHLPEATRSDPHRRGVH
jgi:hypothetical protein